jgi:flagellar M-ring protein FliF
MDTSQLLTRLRGLGANLSPAQLATLGGTFLLVVALVGGSAWWLNAPTYTLLFSDLDPETAGQMVTRLKTLKVAYQLDEGGRAIRVPANRVDELRLELTAQGLPSSGRVGFEIFDRTAFGATEFLEKVNYRRALEGEIARTIATLSEVSGARVHIAMGKETLFGEPRPAKASVVLKLRGTRPLTTSTISGISNLVAASVEGLRPEDVVILDGLGRPLSKPSLDEDESMGAAAHLERQQRIERDMASRVVAMLEPVVGADRVRVNVAASLSPQSREETEEKWDPTTAVVRSRQTSADMSSAAMIGGVAGARANLPVSPADPKAAVAPAAAAAGPGSQRNSETTNYEISRTTRRIVQPPGELARLSVAVLVDDDQDAETKDGQATVTRVARKPEELKKLHDLVAAAVGLDPARGDQLTIENVSFDAPVEDVIEEPGLLVRYAPQVQEVSRLGTVLLIAAAAFFMVIRPLMRSLAPAKPAAAALPVPVSVEGLQRARTVADMENEIEAQIDAALIEKTGEHRRMPVLARKVSAFAEKEPASTAKLLRSWMTEQER